jgi:hypothetical protein
VMQSTNLKIPSCGSCIDPHVTSIQCVDKKYNMFGLVNLGAVHEVVDGGGNLLHGFPMIIHHVGSSPTIHNKISPHAIRSHF